MFSVGFRLWLRYLATREATPCSIPLIQVALKQNLGIIETLALAAMLCVYIDSEYERLIHKMTGFGGITVQAMRYLISNTSFEYRESMEYFTEKHPLFTSGLLSMKDCDPSESDFHDREVLISTETIEVLLGYRVDESVPIDTCCTTARSNRNSIPEVRLDTLWATPEVKRQLSVYINEPDSLENRLEEWQCIEVRVYSKPNIACIWGYPGSGRESLAAAVAGELGLPLQKIAMPFKSRRSDGCDLLDRLRKIENRESVVALHPADEVMLADF